MRIGIFGGDITGPRATVRHAIDAAQRAADDGFHSYWLSQIFNLDALTALAAIGVQVPNIELGTGVVPSFSRHPIVLAQQALTVQSATQGRFTLGLGLSHKLVVEDMYGLSYAKPVSQLREYLAALVPLLHGEAADFNGETVRAHAALEFADVTPPGFLLAALGEKMLRLAAEQADGTITWMTGRQTLTSHTIPTLQAAAPNADKRVVAALPIAVTDDASRARARAAEIFAVYGILPSYRAMLDRESANGPEDVAIIGDAGFVQNELRALADTGVTDFVAVEFAQGDDAKRTRDVLQSLL